LDDLRAFGVAQSVTRGSLDRSEKPAVSPLLVAALEPPELHV
jgi:hypothetical protein